MTSKQIVALLAICCVALAISVSAAAEVEQSTDGRSNVALPKIFDFGRYKSLFTKSYKSVVEELAREKIFLGRAFRAFISLISFKHYRTNHYLKITERSDWTNAELKALHTRKPMNNSEIPKAKPLEKNLSDTPVANVDDIRAKLDELVNSGESGDQISKELEAIARRRRSVDVSVSSDRASLSLEDLMQKPEGEKESAQTADVPSSNPNYQAPELTSYGADDNRPANSQHDENDYNYILSLPGSSYLGSIVSAVNGYFYGNEVVEPTETRGYRPRSRDLTGDRLIVDHRSCMSTPKNQKECGSCYIFSTTALYEWQYCKETGNRVSFSEQYPLDCGERAEMKGCDGGQETEVAYFYGRFGLELRSHYPYRWQSDICPYEESSNPIVMGYIKLNSRNGDMVIIPYSDLEEYLKEAPLLMGLGVSDDFSYYGGGVDMGYDCDPENGHSMAIVGMGIEDGVEYWLFRNSYGPDFGLDGHYKLAKSARDRCLLDNGQGFFLQPSRSGVFKPDVNARYNKRPVDQRFYDVKHHNFIEHNPYTYIEEVDENAVVNRS